ncbi:CUB domain-containing protein 1-like isoform X1 [Polypterus senegalus]|nr:CUB domain-containing protein 1-like isoform X1 [Polypterus senegalus]
MSVLLHLALYLFMLCHRCPAWHLQGSELTRKPGSECVPATKSVMMTIQGNTTVAIASTSPSSKCAICITTNGKQACTANITLTPGPNRTFEFNCTQPQDFFNIEIVRSINCSSNSCASDVTELLSLDFPNFNRTLVWMIKVSPQRSLVLNFPGTGISQINPLENCKDQMTYTILTKTNYNPTSIGTFCRQGAISKINVMNETKLYLRILGKEKVNQPGFTIEITKSIKRLGIVEVVLSPGLTYEFLSPNYPQSFPDDDLMSWNFGVPQKHNATIQFLNYSQPECEKKSVAVEYGLTYTPTISKPLTEVWQNPISGNFNMSLRNCEMTPNDPGILNLQFQVQVSNTSLPARYTIDLQKEYGMHLKIKQKKVNRDCQICISTDCQSEITLQSGNITDLLIRDCNIEHLGMEINKVIGCDDFQNCNVINMPLTIPTVLANLPFSLESFTWQVLAPDNGAIELVPSKGKLQQLLPGQKCSGTFYYKLVKADQSVMGTFCSQGSIEKVQIHSNISVVLLPVEKGNASEAMDPTFNVSIGNEIAESYIFTVSPDKELPVYLVSPHWPAGMPSLASVSWNISLPPKTQAELQFFNTTRPECVKGHAVIGIMGHNSKEEELSFREDVALPGSVTMLQSFWLNITNCESLGRRHVLKVGNAIIVKSQDNTKKIIFGVVCAALAVVAIITTACCVSKRRLKKRREPKVSIYNPGGNMFYPGQGKFPKGRKDNESHIYADIDETMIYGHLLRDTDSSITPEVDVYRPFVGPGGDMPPTPPPVVTRGLPTHIGSSKMIDNELYTFNQHKQKSIPQGNGDGPAQILTEGEGDESLEVENDCENEKEESKL